MVKFICFILSILLLISCGSHSKVCEIKNYKTKTNREEFIKEFGLPYYSDTLQLFNTKMYEYRYPLTNLVDSIEFVIEDVWLCEGKKVFIWFSKNEQEFIFYDVLIWEKGYQY